MSQRSSKRHSFLLAGLAVGMFAFAVAVLPPLYDVICELTGLNGRASAQATLREEVQTGSATVERDVTIQFLAKSARGMPWDFRPQENSLVVRLGELNKATFYVRNRSSKSVTGQAVPSVSPGQAALYLKKIECFCFEQQKLPAGGEMEMGVSFFVDVDLPAAISELTLSYTMFKVGDVEHELLVSQRE